MGEINVTPEFVLAGEATFTVSNGLGEHYTYHVYKSKPAPGFEVPRWFIKVLTGPNNDTDYQYLGMLWWRGSGWNRPDAPLATVPTVKLTGRSRVTDGSITVTVARWALRVIWQAKRDGYQIPNGFSIKHAGKCGRCGAKLTNPASLDTGLGPGCAEQVGVEWAEKPSESAFPDNPGPNDRRTKQNPGPNRRKGPRTVHIIDEHTSDRDWQLARFDLINFFDPSKHHGGF